MGAPPSSERPALGEGYLGAAGRSGRRARWTLLKWGIILLLPFSSFFAAEWFLDRSWGYLFLFLFAFLGVPTLVAFIPGAMLSAWSLGAYSVAAGRAIDTKDVAQLGLQPPPDAPEFGRRQNGA